MKERLNKFLARAGIASRRGADRLIEEGRVRVNGALVTELGTSVNADRDAVKVDGRRVRAPSTPPTYWMLHKPRGYVTTMSDPQGRRTIRDLLHGVPGRVFPVGRLDYDSEGLLLLTSDGELAKTLMHPSAGIPKTYRVKVRGTPDRQALDRLRRGVRLGGRLTMPAQLRVVRAGANCWLEVTLVEGRQRQVRRMLQSVGHPVLKLRRSRIDGVALGRLKPGALRRLTGAELQRLRRAARGGAGEGSPRRN